MEVITIDMITGAIYSLAGLSALVVVLTQIFKDWWNKSGKRWLNHLLSFITSILCNGAVLAIGLIWGVGLYANFDVHAFMPWFMIIGTTAGCGLVANGLWSYNFMKTFLEWLKLMPKPETKAKELETGDGC
jgi:hypothetical protein